MTNFEALALASAIAMLTCSLAFGALAQLLGVRMWAKFSALCLAGGILYMFDGKTQPVGDQPNVFSAIIGASLIASVLILGTEYLELSRRARRVSMSIHATVASIQIALALTHQLTRLEVFTNYSIMFICQAAVAAFAVAPHNRLRFSPAMLALLIYPALLAYVSAEHFDLRYMRYATALVTFLSSFAMLVEGTLHTTAQVKSTLSDLDIAQHQLESVVEAMADGSSKVAGAGEAVSQSAQKLAIRTDQQTASLRHISDAVHGVVGQVQHTADNVAAVDTQCDHLRDQAREGAEVVSDAVEAIQLINQRAQEMSEAINMIESIAFQTNILALNAAIEAARAGTAGRGFAVVAAEVRNLSKRTSESAHVVKGLIERTSSQAGHGVDKVKGVQRQLDAMMQAVEDVATRTREVSTDSSSQSASLNQVMCDLDGLAQLTDANAQLVAESVLAVDDMNGSAMALKAMVAEVQQSGASEFKLTPASLPTLNTAAQEPDASEGVEYF